MNYLILSLLWILYFFIHSFLADNKVKNRIKSNFPGLASSYRIIYNILALILLIPPVFVLTRIDVQAMWVVSVQVKFFSVLLAGGGALIVINAFGVYDMKEFIGAHITNRGNHDLKTDGIFSWVRHPVYLGSLMFLGGYILWNPFPDNILSFILMWIYLLIGIRLEEKKLIEEFGEEYRAYREKVPSLFPLNIFNKSKVS